MLATAHKSLPTRHLAAKNLVWRLRNLAPLALTKHMYEIYNTLRLTNSRDPFLITGWMVGGVQLGLRLEFDGRSINQSEGRTARHLWLPIVGEDFEP